HVVLDGSAAVALVDPVAGEDDPRAIRRRNGVGLRAVVVIRVLGFVRAGQARGVIEVAVVLAVPFDGAGAVHLDGDDLVVESRRRRVVPVGDVDPAGPRGVPGGYVRGPGLFRDGSATRIGERCHRV